MRRCGARGVRWRARAAGAPIPLAALKAKFARPDVRAAARRTIRRRRRRSRSASACSRTRRCPRPAPSPAPPATIPSSSFTDGEPHRQGRHRQAPGAAHADAVERRLQPAAVLGRPRDEPGGPGALSRRASRRDGRHARQRALRRFAAARELRARLRRGLPSRSRASRARNIASALAAYERTLVSPPTRFDALGRRRRRRAHAIRGRTASRCSPARAAASTATRGFAFTDHNFYDIGLPGTDKGRGTEIGLARRRLSPSRRRPCASWPGPRPTCTTARSPRWRMSCATTRRAACARPTRSKDLPRNLKLTDAGARRPRRLPRKPLQRCARRSPRRSPGSARGRAAAAASAQGRDGRQPGQQAVRARAHPPARGADADHPQRRHAHPQRAHLRSAGSTSIPARRSPRRRVTIRFPVAGTFEAFCGIHPSMRLTIDVQ